ncbi:MAG: hypothetical protein Q4G69_03770 [Planctomycetia bacterium]|nr:hypothetical protein [Planctomycetia bacterium]
MDSAEKISLSNDRLFTRGEERTVGHFFLSNSSLPLRWTLVDQRDQKGNRVNRFEIRKNDLIVRADTPSHFYFITVQAISPDKETVCDDFMIFICAEKRITLCRDQWPANKPVQFRVRINEKTVSNTDTAWTTRFPQIKIIVPKGTFHFSSGIFSPFLARLENEEKIPLIPSEIRSIHYSVFKKESRRSFSEERAIEGHQKAEIPVFPWFLKKPIVDLNWNTDKIGYNFLHFPSARFDDPFPEQGVYTVQYDIVPQSEEPVKFFFTVHIVR